MIRAAALVSTLLLLCPPAVAQTGASREDALRALEALDRALGRADQPAAEACLPAPAATADTVFRLHTELMQASLACADAYGTDAYAEYRAFTARHADLLREAQATMVRHLSSEGDGEARFDDYRTALANEESRFLNRFSTERYCAIRESRFESLIDAPPDQLSAYVTDVAGRRQIAGQCR